MACQLVEGLVFDTTGQCYALSIADEQREVEYESGIWDSKNHPLGPFSAWLCRGLTKLVVQELEACRKTLNAG